MFGILCSRKSFIHISNTYFNNNKGKYFGSAISANERSFLSLSNVTLNNNTAGLLGGAVAILNSISEINSSTFTNNGVLDAGNGTGGAINVYDNSFLLVNNCTFYNNFGKPRNPEKKKDAFFGGAIGVQKSVAKVVHSRLL